MFLTLNFELFTKKYKIDLNDNIYISSYISNFACELLLTHKILCDLGGEAMSKQKNK
jgi:hypothetical protein